MADHRGNIPRGIDKNECIRKRETLSVNIRKSKKNQDLRRKRGLSVCSSNTMTELDNKLVNCVDVEKRMRHMYIFACNNAVELYNSQYFQEVLHIVNDESTEPVIFAGAIYVLANIASTDHTEFIIQLGIVPKTIHIVKHHNNTAVREAALTLLGNIVCDSTDVRNTTLDEQVYVSIAQHATSMVATAKERMTVVWFIEMLMHHTTQITDTHVLRHLLQTLLIIITTSVRTNDTTTGAEALQAISKLSRLSCDICHVLCFEGSYLQNLIELANTPGWSHIATVGPIVMVIGDAISRTDSTYTDTILQHDIISQLLSPVYNMEHIKTNTTILWIYSNILVGTREQRQFLVDQGTPILHIIQALQHRQTPQLLTEALWCLNNLVTRQEPDVDVSCLTTRNVLHNVCEIIQQECSVQQLELSLQYLIFAIRYDVHALDYVMETGIDTWIGILYTHPVDCVQLAARELCDVLEADDDYNIYIAE